MAYRARRGNIQLSFEDKGEAQRYAAEGYDVFAESGKLLLAAVGKTVPYAAAERLRAELAALQGKKDGSANDGRNGKC